MLLNLLISFLQIGVLSFGGGYAVIPLIQQYVVEQNGWLSMQEFTDIITISQMTPGPVAVNTSTFVGTRVAGLEGAIVATLGCIIPGVLIALLMFQFFTRRRESLVVNDVLQALKAASAGLICSAAATILMLTFLGVSEITLQGMQFNLAACLVFALCLFGLRKFKLNPILVIALSGVAGYFIHGL